jgi:hypothetical protein
MTVRRAIEAVKQSHQLDGAMVQQISASRDAYMAISTPATGAEMKADRLSR